MSHCFNLKEIFSSIFVVADKYGGRGNFTTHCGKKCFLQMLIGLITQGTHVIILS